MRLFWLVFLGIFTLNLNAISLAKIYKDQNITGWFFSEKLDGIRATWNKQALVTRSGKTINVPKDLLKNFPPFELDGELWSKRGEFEKIVSDVKRGEFKNIKYYIFDARLRGDFFARQKIIKDYFAKHPSSFAVVIKQKKVSQNTDIYKELDKLVSKGAEGIILRDPKAFYEDGRSNSYLKLKPYLDSEAVVIGHKISQKGKYKGKLGSLKVRTKDGKEFFIGTGLSDDLRKNPPAIGTRITFKYNGLTKNNIPRFASFLRIKEKWSDDVQR